jgi:hypothetical protein
LSIKLSTAFVSSVSSSGAVGWMFDVLLLTRGTDASRDAANTVFGLYAGGCRSSTRPVV